MICVNCCGNADREWTKEHLKSADTTVVAVVVVVDDIYDME